MTRTARIVVPGLPHHVTQRGNYRARIFEGSGDYAFYCDLLRQETRAASVAIWAWCLMPNHVHLILVPSDEVGLARSLGRVHRRYAGYVNQRAERTGHLFQERFASTPMDEEHLLAAFAYVSLNPVRARLVDKAEDWPWSSVRAHLGASNDGLTEVAPALSRVPHFRDLLGDTTERPIYAGLRHAETSGQPTGSMQFVKSLEARLGRGIVRARPGRRPSLTANR